MLSILTSGGNIQLIIVQLCAMVFALLLAITFHEWAHGFVAYKNGDMTAKYAGRLTLNPIKHFDPIGFLMLAVVGFGWAKPVPIDPDNFKKLRKGVITTSLAGVIMNLILAFVSCALLAILYAIVDAATGGTWAMPNEFALRMLQLFQYFFIYGIVVNLTLMAFNILPIYPLDGFHVLEMFTRYDNRYCIFMRRYGSMVLLGILLLSSVLGQINPYLDIFGLYMRGIQTGALNLMSLIFRIPL